MADSIDVDIAPDGDVVFVIASTEERSTRIRVDSTVLSNASKVFKTLLGPKFREGTTLAGAGSVEISLPDDNPTSMKLLLQVIHGKNHSVPDKLADSELEALVVVADKYDCIEAIRHTVGFWMYNALSRPCTELGILVGYAQRFRLPQLFGTICYRLVTESKAEISGVESDSIRASLNSLRNGALASLCMIVQNQVDLALKPDERPGRSSTYCCGSGCTFGALYAREYAQFLGKSGLWPLRASTSLEEIYKGINDIGFRSFSFRNIKGCHNNCHAQAAVPYVATSNREYREVAKMSADTVRNACSPCKECGAVFTGKDCEHSASEKPFALSN